MSRIRLSEIDSTIRTREWLCVLWHSCINCGGDLCYGPANAEGKLYDGDPLICAECGMIHYMSVDEDGWEVLASHDIEGLWVFLRDSALAAYRRLLKFSKPWEFDQSYRE